MSTDEKPTVEFQRPPDWAIALTEKMTQGFAQTNANIEVVANDLGVLKGRVGNLETARVADDERARLNSMRAKEPSQHDLQTAASLSEEINARKALADKVTAMDTKVGSIETKTDAQTQILTRLEDGAKALVKHPRFQLLVGILWTALLGYLASKGWVSK